jgi:hypothetical protein
MTALLDGDRCQTRIDGEDGVRVLAGPTNSDASRA